MERMTFGRSRTCAGSSFSRLRVCEGESSSSKTTMPASIASAASAISFSFPLPT